MERWEGLDAEWIPGIHVLVKPIAWLDLRAAGARSYRIPSFQELYLPDRGFERGNEDLRPEDALSGEIGATLRSPFDSDWLAFELETTWFWSRIEDSIAFQLISTNVVAPVNTGRSDTHGYELALRYSPHPWLRMIASRTVTRSEIADTGNPIAGIAVYILGPIAAMLLQMAISRSREYMADDYAAHLTGRPDMLASALARISFSARPRR